MISATIAEFGSVLSHSVHDAMCESSAMCGHVCVSVCVKGGLR